MNKAGLCLFLGLLIGGGVVYFQQTAVHQKQLNELLVQSSTLQTEYNTLESSYSIKVDAYNQLSAEIINLRANYNSLLMDNNKLQNDYDELLYSYCSTTKSFSRVFIKSEIDKIGDIVKELTDNSEDTWYNYQKIWDYVNTNIEYAYDIEMPFISSYNYITLNGNKYYINFDIDTTTNYVQTPKFTLNIKQGDCEDQAILLYGMMKYYIRNIHGTMYNIYISRMEFGDGSGHFAVFMPVQGGNICIMDPAGNYATLMYGTLTQKTASYELVEYNKRWSDEGYITKFEIYWVDDRDGNYSLEVEGDMDKIINFFKNR